MPLKYVAGLQSVANISGASVSSLLTVQVNFHIPVLSVFTYCSGRVVICQFILTQPNLNFIVKNTAKPCCFFVMSSLTFHLACLYLGISTGSRGWRWGAGSCHLPAGAAAPASDEILYDILDTTVNRSTLTFTRLVV